MIRLAALALTVLTGFSGLVYEVAWQRYLAILLGSHGEATAAVLGIFLGGLALGYRSFGSVTGAVLRRAAGAGRPPRLLRLYGYVEAAIGLYALAFPWLFRGVERLSLALPQHSPGLGFAADVALTALLIGPPTVLMGGTIPILSQALARGLADSTRVHAFVYACNTAGAFLGALAAGFVLVPWLGLEGVMWAMGALNLLAGASFLGLGARPGFTASPAPDGTTGTTPRVEGFAAFAAAALLAGFAMMAIQTTLNRLGALAMGASQFTFATIVAVFVLCIALGSLAVSALPRVRAWHLVVSQWLLVGTLSLLYGPLGNVTYWGHLLRMRFENDELAFYLYEGAAFLALLGVFALPIGLSGALLPLLFHHLRQSVGDLGTTAGRLYGWNTLGSLLGALIGGYALLYLVDLHAVYRLSVAALAVGAFLVTARLATRSGVLAGAALLALALAALALRGPWEPQRLSAGLFRSRTPQPHLSRGPDEFFRHRTRSSSMLFYDDGPTASIAVREHPRDPIGGREIAILSNGKSDGSSASDYRTMSLAALVPALFADGCERAFVVGYGTGVTAAELAALDCFDEVVVAEIADGVIEAAPIFDPVNMGASRDPKIRIVRGDAYRTLRRTDLGFDVISSMPSNPWVVGVESLYSREFLEVARSRLRPGGVYAQWFHVYEMDTSTVAMVLATFDSVFEHTSLWFAQASDLLILGFDREEDALDIERLLRRARRPDFSAAMIRARMRGTVPLLAHELLPLGVIRRARLDARIHTLLDPVLSHEAARAFFRGELAPLPFTGGPESVAAARRNSLLQRYGRFRDGELSLLDVDASAQEVCSVGRAECATVLAWWQHRAPESPERESFLAWMGDRLGDESDPELLDRLAGFYGEAAGSGGALSPGEASEAAGRFRRHFHHAFPFEAAALDRIWERCDDGTPENAGCHQARRASLRPAGASRGPAER